MEKMRQMKQAGFSLLELLIAVIIIGIIASAVLPALNTTNTKVNTLNSSLGTIHMGLARFSADTGCYPVKIQALFDKTQATGAATDVGFCTASVATAVQDQYIEPLAYDTTNNAILLPKIGASVQVKTGYDGTGTVKIWSLDVAGLTDDLIGPAVNSCNGVVDSGATPASAWANTVKCIKSGTTMKYAFHRK
jgi:prepilin-type N-terminal cleavage/methylation domain-containing protein